MDELLPLAGALERAPVDPAWGSIGCFLIRTFPLACELAGRPELHGRPVVVGRPDSPTVWASSTAAQRFGIWPGQAIRHAETLCPSLAIIDARPARYRDTFERLLTNLEQVVPGVEPHPDGADGYAYLDLRGLERRYSSIDALTDAVMTCAPATLRPRLGVASSKFPALVAATTAEPLRAVVIATKSVAAFLAGQPLDVLPVSPDLLARLRLFGIETLGAISAFPKTALTAEFGREGTAAWLLARGDDPEPLRPRPCLDQLSEKLWLDSPIVTREQLLVAIEQLVRRSCRSPQFRGRAVRQAILRIVSERGEQRERLVTFKEAIADSNELWRLLCSALGEVQTPGPVVEIALHFTHLTRADGWQKTLPVGSGLRLEFLEEGLRKLRTQYGRCPVSQITAVEPDSRFPENRWALIDRNP